jgi:hypothetical protein
MHDDEVRLPGQVTIGQRIMWWPPWACTHWWRLWLWRGADEYCNPSLCLDVPLAGCFIVFWRRHLRAMPCEEDRAAMGEEQRADYLPGGYLRRSRP